MFKGFIFKWIESCFFSLILRRNSTDKTVSVEFNEYRRDICLFKRVDLVNEEREKERRYMEESDRNVDSCEIHKFLIRITWAILGRRVKFNGQIQFIKTVRFSSNFFFDEKWKRLEDIW